MKQGATEGGFHGRLRQVMDDYVRIIYDLTRKFPREELYGMTSQLRRSALSVVLNYIEGYARGGNRVYRNFLDIAYGSLKESRYLLEFAEQEGYISSNHSDSYARALRTGDEIGAMLWSTRKLLN